MQLQLATILWTSALFSALAAPVVFGLFLFGSRRLRGLDSPLRWDPAPGGSPGVTLLKPCAGLDDDLEACIESYCRLRYPKLQVLLGVRDESDPALPVLRLVKERHPEIDLEVFVTRSSKFPSPKISTVEFLQRHARYGLLWMSDSNTRVHPDTLTDLVEKLHEPGVGMVVSPLVSEGAQTPGARLDALTIDLLVGLTTFSVYTLLGMVSTPGKSVLFRAETLGAVGGWDEVGRYFGEDIIFMEAVRAMGLRLALGSYAVANVTRSASLARYRSRHLRWAQIRWRFSLFGAGFEPLLAPLVPAAVLALAAPSRATLAMLALAFVEQVALDLGVYRRVTGRWPAPAMLPWMLVRPFSAFYLTVRGVYAGRVEWRGNVLYMGARGRCQSEPPLAAFLRSLGPRSR